MAPARSWWGSPLVRWQIASPGELANGASPPRKQLLTPDEALRAIYIDFEGRTDEPPALLGSLYFEGRSTPDPDRLVLRHDVLDPSLYRLAGAVEISGPYLYECLARTLPQAVHDLVRRAKNQHRPIVAWSHHEIKKLDEAGLSEYAEDLVHRRFQDGKATARRWRLDLHPEWRLERDAAGRADRLPHYLERIGYQVPEEFQGGRVGETIKQLRGTSGEWCVLTVAKQRRWSELLLHNFDDCNGLREVVQLAAGELALQPEPG